jgi:glycosyltransferase involved in cell wall biosynthesis
MIMRILFLSNYYPPHEVGGYEQLCRDVAQRLIKRGHETFVLTSDHGMHGSEGAADASNIFRVLVIQPDYNRRLNATWQFFLTRPWADRHNRRWLRKTVAQVQPDVIFIWNIQGLTRRLALDAESIPGVAVAYWLAGYSPAEPDEFWYYWSIQPKLRSHLGALKDGLRRVAFGMMRREGQPLRPTMTHVAVVSRFMCTKGIAEGMLPEHSKIIYNGVEVEEFLRPVQLRNQEPLRLLQAGRVSDDKGVHTAVEAVAYLVREQGLSDVHLTVAGTGRADYQARLHEIIQRFDLGNHITMTGWLPREQMPELMAKSHVLLLPTITEEPFARVVLEAMAGGLAVIAADTGGTSEIVQHERTGLLFPGNDSRSLAQQILRLAEDDKIRQKLARSGQQVVSQQFSMDRMVDELEGFLGEVMDLQHGIGSSYRAQPAS